MLESFVSQALSEGQEVRIAPIGSSLVTVRVVSPTGDIVSRGAGDTLATAIESALGAPATEIGKVGA